MADISPLCNALYTGTPRHTTCMRAGGSAQGPSGGPDAASSAPSAGGGGRGLIASRGGLPWLPRLGSPLVVTRLATPQETEHVYTVVSR